MTYYYHFTGFYLRNGRPLSAIGEWLEHKGELRMYVSGLHASPTPFDALQYAPGPLLHLVELDGETVAGSDKVVCRKRKIVASIDATDLLRKFACTVALKVIHIWDAPLVVREYLETGDESKRAAARDAARAARDAARDAGEAAWVARVAALAAAGNAALAAARAAAQDAALAAAWDAARDRNAAWAAAWAEYGQIFNTMAKKALQEAQQQ
jgi:hypothetical protein